MFETGKHRFGAVAVAFLSVLRGPQQLDPSLSVSSVDTWRIKLHPIEIDCCPAFPLWACNKTALVPFIWMSLDTSCAL